MLLNTVERMLVDNRVRAWLQRKLEVPHLRRVGGPVHGGRALEMGCGIGSGTEQILELMGAARVDAFDLDPAMVAKAQARLSRFGDRCHVWIGDAARIDADDRTYDAVFDFAIVHHVPEWRRAVREAYRVLRPGGRFFVEEVFDRFILNPVIKRVLDHPLEDRFGYDDFRAELEAAGFVLIGSGNLFDHFGWYVAERPLGT